MRIAIVSHYIATTPEIKYYQSQQVNLAFELSKLGIEVDILTLKRRNTDNDIEQINDKVTIYRLPVISIWLEKLLRQPIMRGLWRCLKKKCYDFIQSSDDFSLNTLYAAMYCLFYRKRLIIYQGFYEYSRKPFMKLLMLLYDLLAGPILRKVCWIAICKTNAARKYLEKKGFKKTKVIPVGVNTSLFYPVVKNTAKTFTLLTVGNLIPRKNYYSLLEAFKFLTKNIDIQLTIIGKGPEKRKIISYIQQYNLVDKVRLLKDIPNNEMHLFYSQADLFLLLSKIEIFGMVILEAMACGCPVISTPTPGALDVIVDNRNGFILSNTDPWYIAQRIQSILLNQKLLLKVREEAINTAHGKYSWEKIAQQYYQLYLTGSKNENRIL